MMMRKTSRIDIKTNPTSKEGETAAFLAASKNKRHFSEILNFGTQVMTAVAECITPGTFLKRGNVCLCEGKSALEERLPTLQLVFNTCTSKCDFKIPEPRKEGMVHEIHTVVKGRITQLTPFGLHHLKSTNLVGVVTDKQALAKAEVKKKRKR
jgi:hypothetical protein